MHTGPKREKLKPIPRKAWKKLALDRRWRHRAARSVAWNKSVAGQLALDHRFAVLAYCIPVGCILQSYFREYSIRIYFYYYLKDIAVFKG